MRTWLAPVISSAPARWLALLVCLVLAPASPTMQAPADIAVVVNAAVPVENLTTAELRRLILGDREFWTSGTRVTLLIRAPVARERDVAVKNICQMTEAQFRQHWISKVFRADTANGPKVVYSNEMALEQAGRTAGAIAFVAGPVTNRNVKVLKIDGKSPGQVGYSLR